VDRVVSLIVCGAPLAARAPDLVARLVTSGWTVSVVGTAASTSWIDEAALGAPIRRDYRSPAEPKRDARPGVVVVCPATFNTLNKAAAGIADSYALGVLCEALGAGTPALLVPMVNDRLWGHPSWARSLAILAESDATFIDIRTGALGTSPVPSGTGGEVVANFDPAWIASRLAALG